MSARDLKAVPGRETDVKDAEWIADLLRHGLLKGSFVPHEVTRTCEGCGHTMGCSAAQFLLLTL